MEFKSYYHCPIGEIILTSDSTYLTGLWFTTTRFEELTIVKEEQRNDQLKIFQQVSLWLDRYFNREEPKIEEIPIKLIGSAFCLKVWNILKTIPYGTTITYGKIAKQISPKMSAQAVGYAVGHNPISIIIPCHRVVGKNNFLTGYAGGLDKKVKLLELEKQKGFL